MLCIYAGLPQRARREAQDGGETVSQRVDDGGGSGGRWDGWQGRDGGHVGEQTEAGHAAAEMEHAVAPVARHEEETAGQLCRPTAGKSAWMHFRLNKTSSLTTRNKTKTDLKNQTV